MKKIAYALVLFFFLVLTSKAKIFSSDEDWDVKKMILDTYIESVFLTAVEGGTEFKWDMMDDSIIYKNGVLDIIARSDVKNENFNNPLAMDSPTSYEIKAVKVAGKSGFAVIELYNGTVNTHTNIISFYKFEHGWEIITKLFYVRN